MAFKSEAQRRKMHADHPAIAKRWESEMKDTKLPERIGVKRAPPPHSQHSQHSPPKDIYTRNEKGRIY